MGGEAARGEATLPAHLSASPGHSRFTLLLILGLKVVRPAVCWEDTGRLTLQAFLGHAAPTHTLLPLRIRLFPAGRGG